MVSNSQEDNIAENFIPHEYKIALESKFRTTFNEHNQKMARLFANRNNESRRMYENRILSIRAALLDKNVLKKSEIASLDLNYLSFLLLENYEQRQQPCKWFNTEGYTEQLRELSQFLMDSDIANIDDATRATATQLFTENSRQLLELLTQSASHVFPLHLAPFATAIFRLLPFCDDTTQIDVEQFVRGCFVFSVTPDWHFIKLHTSNYRFNLFCLILDEIFAMPPNHSPLPPPLPSPQIRFEFEKAVTSLGATVTLHVDDSFAIEARDQLSTSKRLEIRISKQKFARHCPEMPKKKSLLEEDNGYLVAHLEFAFAPPNRQALPIQLVMRTPNRIYLVCHSNQYPKAYSIKFAHSRLWNLNQPITKQHLLECLNAEFIDQFGLPCNNVNLATDAPPLTATFLDAMLRELHVRDAFTVEELNKSNFFAIWFYLLRLMDSLAYSWRCGYLRGFVTREETRAYFDREPKAWDTASMNHIGWLHFDWEDSAVTSSLSSSSSPPPHLLSSCSTTASASAASSSSMSCVGGGAARPVVGVRLSIRERQKDCPAVFKVHAYPLIRAEHLSKKTLWQIVDDMRSGLQMLVMYGAAGGARAPTQTAGCRPKKDNFLHKSDWNDHESWTKNRTDCQGYTPRQYDNKLELENDDDDYDD